MSQLPLLVENKIIGFLVEVMIHHVSRSSAKFFLRRNLLSLSRKLCSHSAPVAASSISAVRNCSTVKEEEEEWRTSNYRLKLTEIPFQAKVANAVQLIGTVSLPVSLEMDKDDGMRKAVTLLVQKKNHDFPTFSIPIVFQGDMAEVAIWHLKENDTVYVTGMLASHEDGDGQSNLKVIVDNVSFVQSLGSTKKSNSDSKEKPQTKKIPSSVAEEKLLDKEIAKSTGHGKKSRETSENMWNDIVSNPQQWLDCREHKRNGFVKPKFPDFVNKKSKDGLWLDSAPEFILVKLNDLTFDLLEETRHASSSFSMKTKAKNDEELWKNLVENPSSWWDNRATKLKSNHPDFKHKDTGNVLWLNSRTPAWVLPKLPSNS